MNPSLLWLLPCAAAFGFWFLSRTGERLRAAFKGYISKQLAPTRIPALRARALFGLAALCLILAAAGLQYRHASRKIQVVVAVDVSPSIFELTAQTARVRELLGALDPETTEAAVVVFSATAGLERPMSPLPSTAVDTLSSNRSANPAVKKWPDFSHLNAVVKMDGTDIAGALQAARGAFTATDGARAILLLSDFRDTKSAGSAASGAGFLQGSGIDLLATPAILGPSSDVQLAEFRVPETATVGRAVPLEITIASQQPATVVVNVSRICPGQRPKRIDSKSVTLDESIAAGSNGELRKTVRIVDHPSAPGVAVYTATITGDLQRDVSLNNSLSAAVPISGPSRWAVLTRPNSTLAKLAADPARPLGVETRVFVSGEFPTEAARYEPFAGILVDGLSAAELPDGGPALLALTRAVDGGKALVALGGEAAFGAGGHPRDGAWERLLPIELTPEDDRARAVLFLIDVSNSMGDPMLHDGIRVSKMDFAAQQLQAVNQLRPQDRLGLIEFSGGAKLASPLTNEPTRRAFLNAVHDIRIEAKTDFLPALELAKETLDANDAEIKLVLLISDGVDTSGRPPDDVLNAARKLCADPSHKTTIWTFGIDVGSEAANVSGEKLLKGFAEIGHGTYSAEFSKLGPKLGEVIDTDKAAFYTRVDAFVPRAGQSHVLVSNNSAWPTLHFRNRVKAKSGADALLLSGAFTIPHAPGAKKERADPLLILSGPDASSLSRRAVLALSLDGENGAEWLAPNSAGRTLLGRVMSWTEAGDDAATNGVSLHAEPFGNDQLAIELRMFNPVTGEPENALNPLATITLLQNAGNDIETTGPVSTGGSNSQNIALRPVAPGTYRGTSSAPPAAVCRLTVRENGRTLAERFVSTPCAAEMRRFGVDRAAMTEWLEHAGPTSQPIESPRSLAQWAAEKDGAVRGADLRSPLLLLALLLLFIEYGLRGKRSGL